MDQNTLLENSLSSANVELENLREKSKDLENHIREIRQDNKLKKEEFQEELDKAVIAQFENFILHKFIKEVEEKNYSLLVENEIHVSESKLADKLISELETEILEQQVEEELLLVEVENLRLGIYQVFLSLEIGSKHEYETSKISIDEIIGNINNLKSSLLKEEDEKQRLLLKNNVILTLLHQLKDDNKSLKNTQIEFAGLKQMKERLEGKCAAGLDMNDLNQVGAVATVDDNVGGNDIGKEDVVDSSYVFVGGSIEVSAADPDDTGGVNVSEIVPKSDTPDDVFFINLFLHKK